MRVFGLIAAVAVAAPLIACHSEHVPQSASMPPDAATVAEPQMATLNEPIAEPAPQAIEANGPPLNILKPPR